MSTACPRGQHQNLQLKRFKMPLLIVGCAACWFPLDPNVYWMGLRSWHVMTLRHVPLVEPTPSLVEPTPSEPWSDIFSQSRQFSTKGTQISVISSKDRNFATYEVPGIYIYNIIYVNWINTLVIHNLKKTTWISNHWWFITNTNIPVTYVPKWVDEHPTARVTTVSGCSPSRGQHDRHQPRKNLLPLGSYPWLWSHKRPNHLPVCWLALTQLASWYTRSNY